MRGSLVTNGFMNKKPHVKITSQTMLYKELRLKSLEDGLEDFLQSISTT